MDPEKQKKILKLHNEGKSYSQITEECRVSYSTIAAAIRESGILPQTKDIICRTVEPDGTLSKNKNVKISEKNNAYRKVEESDIISIKRILKSILSRKNSIFFDEAMRLLQVLK